jgi:hypothetical protein
MDNALETKFDKMGARVKVKVRTAAVSAATAVPIRVDIRRDNRGEYFDIHCREDVSLEVLDVKRADRHLLLMSRERLVAGREIKSKFLCGHDERCWFVAAIPESSNARDVQSAKDALKPDAVWASIRAHAVRPHKRDLRRNEAFVRQGEWFFIPRPRVSVDEKLVLKHEPIRRGAGKPHLCQFLYRTGGERVYVRSDYPNGLTVQQYRELAESQRRRSRWQTMVRDARVYVRGAVRHPDHKTVWLKCWHEVVMNTETRARAMRHVAFLD